MRAPELPMAVVGAGRWGALHAAKLHALPGVRVSAIIDPQLDRARRLAESLGAQALPDLAALTDACAVTIAVPHAGLANAACRALEMGLHVLVEKPLAQTVEDAQHLVSIANSSRRLLKVGFLERFNPAIAGWRPGDFLIARRVGPLPAANLTLDWLVHDLDLAHWLLGPDLTVRAARVEPGAVRVALSGAAGRARLTARAGPSVRRRLRDARGVRDLVGEGDALGAQMRAFVGAIRGDHDPRLADGLDAVRVLTRVAEIQRLSAE